MRYIIPIPHNQLISVAKRAQEWHGANPLTYSRKPKFVSARRYMIQELAARGYTGCAIGRAMGMHSTTVSYHLQKNNESGAELARKLGIA